MTRETSALEPIVQIGLFPEKMQSQIDEAFLCLPMETVVADEGLRRSVRGIITRSNYQVPITLLDQLPELRVISTCGVGYDGIPVDAARARGIVVTHTPGVLDAAVCELGIGLLLALLRKIPQSDQYVRTGEWQGAGAFPLTTSLHGLRVGIVGMGRIGSGLACRLEAFGVELAYSGGRAEGERLKHFAAVEELAYNSDVLIVCCSGGEKTRHLINGPVLRALGAGWLVNISRGSVVDEEALCWELQHGCLRGAALDVFAHEPLGPSSLRDFPNVLLSPHAGSATHEAREKMLRLTLHNLREVLSGGRASTPVPSDSGASRGARLSWELRAEGITKTF